MSEVLTSSQRQTINEVLQGHSDVFSDVPSKTHIAVHNIETGDATPVRQKPYRIPHVYKECFKQEIEQMLRQGIINIDWIDFDSILVRIGSCCHGSSRQF